MHPSCCSDQSAAGAGAGCSGEIGSHIALLARKEWSQGSSEMNTADADKLSLAN